jgi:pimeloyl-ACP methyl ester carboxylesterase
VGLIITLLALVVAGGVYQRIALARHRRMFGPPGQLIDVGGHRLHALCRGRGSPLVLLESAIAASSLSWARVQPAIAEFTQVCAYDRAGLAWSDPPCRPPTFDGIVDELGALLAKVAPRDRCVLVGHSFGSLIVRAYAARHPSQVAGLVLVDPPMEWLRDTRERARMLSGGRRLSKVGALLAHVGVVRASLALLSGGAPGVPRRFVKIFGPTAARTLERMVGEVQKLPPELHPVVQAHWCQPKCFHAMADYMLALERDGGSIATLVPPRDIPVVVISSGRQPPEEIAEHRALAQASLAGRHIVAEASGHWVPFDEPHVIVAAVRQLVESVSEGTQNL